MSPIASSHEYREDPNVSAWVDAHAGSGKTYALVRRVIALMLRGAKPQTIWCMTYTNNAAAEIEARILQQLNRFAQMDDVALRAELSDYLGEESSEAACARIRQLATDTALPGKGIICTTMHGLCQQLLRVFALDLGLLPDFSILTAEAARELLLQAVDEVFTQAITKNSGALYGAVEHVSSQVKYPAAKQKLCEMLKRPDHIKNLLLQTGGTTYSGQDDLSDVVYAVCGAENDKGASVQNILADARAQTPSVMGEIAEAFAQGKGKDVEKASLVRGWLSVSDQAIELEYAWRLYCSIFYKKDGELRAKLSNKGTFSEGGALAQALAREQLRVQKTQARLANLALAKDSESMLVLAVAALDRFAQLKAATGALDFDDLLQLVSQLVADDGMLGHVMQKLDYRVEHILLDEAQDTSPAQWQILSQLITELCDTPPREGQVPRSVFVVGDIKQSIYRFQGAAPEMMRQQRDALQALYANHGFGFNIGTLPVARRSVSGILQLVDQICAHEKVQNGLMQEEVKHVALRENLPATMAVFPLVEADKVEKPSGFTMPMEYSLGAKSHDKLAHQIAQEIRGWLNERRVIIATGKAVSAGDIMIIVRNRGKLVPALIRALQQAHIPVAGIDRLKLSEHILVKDILALIRFVYQPADDLSLAQVLRSPLVGLSEEALFALAHDRAGSLFDALECAGTHDDVQAFLEDVKTQQDEAVYGWLNRLFYHHGAAKRYRARMGEEICEVIDALMDHAASLHGSAEAGLLYFLKHMQHSELVVQRANDGTTDMVRILTTHGAKGLEAPIVILADTTSTPNLNQESVYYAQNPVADSVVPICQLSDAAKSGDALIEQKQQTLQALQREYYRALYVAVTRACDELYVFGVKPKAVSCLHWHEVITQAMQLFSGVQEDESGALWVRQARKSDGVIPPVGFVQKVDDQLPGWVCQPLPIEKRAILLTPSAIHVGDENDNELRNRHSADVILPSDPRQYGMVFHGLLQWMRADASAMLIETACTQTDLPDADKKLLQKTIQQLFANTEVKNLLSLNAVTERAVAATLRHEDQEYDVFGVVDRLIETSDGYVILDYKTSLNPPDADQIPQSYLLQMKLYQLALQKVFPDRRLRSALLWTHNARLDWLDEPLSQISFQKITQNLSAQKGDSLDVRTHAA